MRLLLLKSQLSLFGDSSRPKSKPKKGKGSGKTSVRAHVAKNPGGKGTHMVREHQRAVMVKKKEPERPPRTSTGWHAWSKDQESSAASAMWSAHTEGKTYDTLGHWPQSRSDWFTVGKELGIGDDAATIDSMSFDERLGRQVKPGSDVYQKFHDWAQGRSDQEVDSLLYNQDRMYVMEQINRDLEASQRPAHAVEPERQQDQPGDDDDGPDFGELLEAIEAIDHTEITFKSHWQGDTRERLYFTVEGRRGRTADFWVDLVTGKAGVSDRFAWNRVDRDAYLDEARELVAKHVAEQLEPESDRKAKAVAKLMEDLAGIYDVTGVTRSRSHVADVVNVKIKDKSKYGTLKVNLGDGSVKWAQGSDARLEKFNYREKAEGHLETYQNAMSSEMQKARAGKAEHEADTGHDVDYRHPVTGDPRKGTLHASGMKGATVIDHETGESHRVDHGHYQAKHPADDRPHAQGDQEDGESDAGGRWSREELVAYARERFEALKATSEALGRFREQMRHHLELGAGNPRAVMAVAAVLVDQGLAPATVVTATVDQLQVKGEEISATDSDGTTYTAHDAPRAAEVLQSLLEGDGPVFQVKGEPMTDEQLVEYIAGAGGPDIKDLRRWHATRLWMEAATHLGAGDNPEKTIRAAADHAGEALGEDEQRMLDRCVDPTVVAAFRQGITLHDVQGLADAEGLSKSEQQFLAVLEVIEGNNPYEGGDDADG